MFTIWNGPWRVLEACLGAKEVPKEAPGRSIKFTLGPKGESQSEKGPLRQSRPAANRGLRPLGRTKVKDSTSHNPLTRSSTPWAVGPANFNYSFIIFQYE